MKNPDAVGLEYLVQLDRDHPGFRDPAYRVRRDAIARAAVAYRKGEPVPDIDYTEDEQAVWRMVSEELRTMHERHACDAYLRARRSLRLNPERIPQLSELNPILLSATGFHMIPVAGLVVPEIFLSHLGDGLFLSTQYARHHSRPLYTPEPDVILELVGHAVTLVDPTFAEVNRRFGEALARGADVNRLTRVYWYTLEFGAVWERGEARAYGAGLLSSFGELGHFAANTPLLPFDLDRIADTPYDPTDYQRCIFVAPSLDHAFSRIVDWLSQSGADAAPDNL